MQGLRWSLLLVLVLLQTARTTPKGQCAEVLTQQQQQEQEQQERLLQAYCRLQLLPQLALLLLPALCRL
jgi:hypothetical protein